MKNPYEILKSKELDEFVNELNQRFRWCMYDGICMYAPTGEEYIIISPNAITKKDVIIKYKESIEMYCGMLKDDHTIYWRKYPELRSWSQGCNIYSRLLVSKLPIDARLVKGEVTMMEYRDEQIKKRVEKS